MMETPAARPFYAQGNFAPVEREVTSGALEVEGAIPPNLDGVYIRNGPNPARGESPYWFTGEGMLHGVALSGGAASWYRNRYVGEGKSAANTSVVAHAGRLFALVENAVPTQVGAELETLGQYDFGGRLKTPFTAHPIVDPATGEMHFFGYSPMAPYLTYHRADAAGVLQQSTAVDVKGPTMMHAFVLTDAQAIFMDLPVVFDWALAARGMPFCWSDDYGARLGLARLGPMSEPARWVDIDPCYVFHPLNAFEDGAETVIDVVRYDEMWRGGPPADRFESAYLYRWRIGQDGRVHEQRLDDRSIEFPRVDPRRAGLPYRFGYAVRTDEAGGGIGSGTVVKYDLETGGAAEYVFPDGTLLSELAFTPASAAAGEDEGWLIGYIYSRARDTSALVILDAQALAKGPVATVWLPQRVPQGFHGAWIDAESLGAGRG